MGYENVEDTLADALNAINADIKARLPVSKEKKQRFYALCDEVLSLYEMSPDPKAKEDAKKIRMMRFKMENHIGK